MMLKIILTILIIVYCSVCSANVPLMPISDLEPGMKGIAKTVVQGDTIEEFDVEVVGVQGSTLEDQAILVKCSGDLIEKTGGIAQGMSGSPVYIDGRLVGAVAFGKHFNDPHWCYLTPIGRMLRLLEEDTVEGFYFPGNNEKATQLASLQAGGFSDIGIERLQEALGANIQLQSVVNGGQVSAKPFEPGSAISASFCTGDLTLGALGTVTWVDDEGKVLAFGHQFMQRGQSNYFMNKAWVLGCIPNQISSYKVGNIGEPVGVINQDRMSGIAGQVGTLPSSVPVEINVSDGTRGRQDTVRLQVLQDEKLLPDIIDAAVLSSVNRLMDRAGGGTAAIEYTLEWWDASKQLVTLERKNMYYAYKELLRILNQELNDSTVTLMSNKLEPVRLRRVTVKCQVDDKVRIAEMTKLSYPKEVKAGELLPITVTLKPYRGAEFTKVVNFKVPVKYAGKKLTLSVRGGTNVAWIMRLLRKQKENAEEQVAPTTKKQEAKRQTLADYAKETGEGDQNNQIIVDLASKVKPINEESFRAVLKGSEFKQRFEYDFIIDGEQEFSVRVK